MAQPYVEVLYDFESKTAKGHAINVQAGERYSLIIPGSNDEWCLVCRPTDVASQFYLPKSYVRNFVEQPPDSPVSTFLPSHRHSVTPDLEGRTRQNSMFASDGFYNVLSSPSTAANNAQRRLQPSPSRKSPGFKLADPKRISNSIPGDLNFVHNISDLAAAQEMDEKNRLRRDDDEERKPLTAVPRMSLAANGFNGVDIDSPQSYDMSSGLQRAASFSPSSSPARRMMESRLRTPVKPDDPEVSTSTVEPSAHHYQNVNELENAATERPPVPDVSDEPVRVLNDGWVEYSLNGRPYFFHQQTGYSQWKPPRLLATPAEVSAMLSSSGDELDSSTYSAVDDLQRSQASDQRSVSQSPILDACGPPPLEQAPPVPHEISQSPPKESSATMTDSVDSGFGRMSLSLRNQAYGMRLPGAAVVDGNFDAYLCSEDLANVIGSDMAAGSGYSRNSSMPMSFQQQKTIKNGSLDKCKTAEAGHKLKKKEWSPCFVFLTSAHMIFYKDEKSAEKFGRHYPAPLGVCDLRGARLSWVDKERDKRRKHVFQILQLELIDGTSYLFTTANSQDINGWFHALRQVIAKLPLPDFYPTPVVVLEQEHVRRGSLIGRTSSTLTASSSGIGRLRLDSAGSGVATMPAVDKQAKKGKRRSAYVGNGPPPVDDDQIAATSASASDANQTRDTIIERLRRFFRSRPSIESLKEKGIYKPEPVFGSTLVEISLRERNTVPKFVRVVTEVIEAKGLDVDGLYRVSGNLSAIQKIRCQVDQDKYNGLVGEDDVHVLTGALKLFFRELQEPIFPFHMTKDLLNAIRLQNQKQRFRTFEDLLGKMPRCHQDTLHLLLKHLARVASHSAQNRMQMHNLAIVFGPTLFSNGALEKPTDKAAKDKLKPVKRSSAGKVSVAAPPPHAAEAVQSNSHLAFNMIMQGQIVEYMLKEQDKFHFFNS